MTDSYQPDLEQVAWLTKIETLEHRFRELASTARHKAGFMDYQEGYADACDRIVQALRELQEDS